MWRCISVVVVVVVLTALSVCVYVPFGFGGDSTTFSLFSFVAKCFLYVCVDFFVSYRHNFFQVFQILRREFRVSISTIVHFRLFLFLN